MAIGAATFSGIGGGIADLYAASADRYRAQGARIEGERYLESARLADLNATYTKELTNIKEYQTQRSIFKTLGAQQAEVAASGFTKSGSALDLERDSATQGAMAKAVLGQQGQIEEAGYEQQAASYRLMANSANMAATAADHAAQGATLASFLHFASAAFSLLPGGASAATPSAQERSPYPDPYPNPWSSPWSVSDNAFSWNQE